MVHKGWEISETDSPWPWMRFMARKDAKLISAASEEEIREAIEKEEELKLWPMRREEDIVLDEPYIRSALERMGDIFINRMRIEFPGGEAFVFRGAKFGVPGWYLERADMVWYEEMREKERGLRYELAGAKGAERERLAREVERVVEEIRRWPERRPKAVFRRDAYGLAREILKLSPTRVVLLGR